MRRDLKRLRGDKYNKTVYTLLETIGNSFIEQTIYTNFLCIHLPINSLKFAALYLNIVCLRQP